MRSSVLIALLLVLASVQADPLANLQTYVSAVFQAFDISDISDLMACYNETTAGIQLTDIATFVPWGVAYGAGAHNTFNNISNYMSDLNSDMEPVWNCATETSEFENLLIALNATHTIHDAIWPNFFNAHVRDFAIKYATGYAAFLAKNYQTAGSALAPILIQGAANASNINLTDFLGFANGLFWAWNVTLPTDSVYCFNQNSVNTFLDLLNGWFNAILNADATSAAQATTDFYNSAVSEINGLLRAVQSCVVGSNDHTKVTNALGIDFNSAQYRQNFQSYMENVEAAFYNQSLFAGEYFVSNQVFEAGILVGQLLETVADYSSDSEEIVA